MPMPLKDITGQRFGLLLVLRYLGKKTWLCQCDCGVEISVYKSNLGVTTNSCGCLKGYRRQELRNKRLVSDKDAALNHLFSGYRTYRKNTRWELSRDQFHVLITADCHYCGTPRSNLYIEKWKTKERKGEIRFQFRYNGLDRKDNTKGYIQGNVVTCCIRCNKAKGESSYEEFVAYLKCVVENYPILTLEI